jgi:transcriptional regulator with XRE-family HTH domain
MQPAAQVLTLGLLDTQEGPTPLDGAGPDRRLHATRTRLGLSQPELANYWGISVATLRRMEGKPLDPYTRDALVGLCVRLGRPGLVGDLTERRPTGRRFQR